MKSSAHANGDYDDRISRGRIYRRNIGSLSMGIWSRRISRLIGGLCSFFFLLEKGRGEGLIAFSVKWVGMEWNGRGDEADG